MSPDDHLSILSICSCSFPDIGCFIRPTSRTNISNFYIEYPFSLGSYRCSFSMASCSTKMFSSTVEAWSFMELFFITSSMNPLTWSSSFSSPRYMFLMIRF